MVSESYVVMEWEPGWEGIAHDDHLCQAQLRRELSTRHPLAPMQPLVFGRCKSCDDVVAALAHVAGEPELAVIHLTWSTAPPESPAESVKWPHFERMGTPEFIRRFLRGDEHL